MAVFACGIHNDGCVRDECVQRAVDGRMALEYLMGREPIDFPFAPFEQITFKQLEGKPYDRIHVDLSE